MEQFKDLLSQFKMDHNQTTILFNTLKSNKERRIIHELCEELGLFSVSSGPPNNRVVKVTKTEIIQPLEITDDDRKLFIRDSMLPIPAWRSPYFEYFIDLYKDFYGSAQIYDQFTESVKILKTRTGNDELIISVTKERLSQTYHEVKILMDQLPSNMQGIWRLEAISIEPLGSSTVFIKRIYEDGDPNIVINVSIKSVEKDFHAQAYKAYMKQPLVSFDMKAMKDNYLITYEDPYLFNI